MSEYENQQRQQFEENAEKFQFMADFDLKENERMAFSTFMRLETIRSNPRVNPAKVSGLEQELADYEEQIEKAQHLELELMREFEQLRQEYLNET